MKKILPKPMAHPIPKAKAPHPLAPTSAIGTHPSIQTVQPMAPSPGPSSMPMTPTPTGGPAGPMGGM